MKKVLILCIILLILLTGWESHTDYILIDVRRIDEFEEGHLPGAINILNESVGTEVSRLHRNW